MVRASLLVLLTIISIIRAADPIVCPDPILFTNSALDANFVVSDGDQQSTCVTAVDNVVFDAGSNPPAVNLGIGEAPATSPLPIACAHYRMATQTKFGRYTCRMKAQNAPGVVSSCYWGSATSGNSYQEIYFRFYGTNNTRVHIGYYTFSGGAFDKEIPLTLPSDADFQSYTFEYNNNAVRWYINGIQQFSVSAGTGTNTPIPNINGFFRLSYVTSNGQALENSRYGIYDGATSTISVANFTYVPTCSSSIDISSDAESTSTSGDKPDTPSWLRECTKKAPFTLYDDDFGNGVTDTSGSSLRDSKSTGQVLSGSNSFSWTVEENSMLSLTMAKPVLLKDNFWALEMWLISDNTNKQIKIAIYSGTTMLGSPLSLSDYFGPSSTLEPYKWMRVQIPLADFRAETDLVESFNRIELTPTFAAFFGELWLDKIILTHGTPCLGKSQFIYEDGLAEGWTDNSWGTRSLSAADVTAEGSSASMYMRLYKSGLRLHNNAGFSVNDWYAVSFQMQVVRSASLVGNPTLNVGITHNGGQDYKSFPLANYYSGTFPEAQGEFVTITIPLYDFGVYSGMTVNGIWLQDPVDNDEGKLYVDNMRLFQKAVDVESEDSSVASPIATCSLALVAITAAALML